MITATDMCDDLGAAGALVAEAIAAVGSGICEEPEMLVDVP